LESWIGPNFIGRTIDRYANYLTRSAHLSG
jgi:hypothetical protein